MNEFAVLGTHLRLSCTPGGCSLISVQMAIKENEISDVSDQRRMTKLTQSLQNLKSPHFITAVSRKALQKMHNR